MSIDNLNLIGKMIKNISPAGPIWQILISSPVWLSNSSAQFGRALAKLLDVLFDIDPTDLANLLADRPAPRGAAGGGCRGGDPP